MKMLSPSIGGAQKLCVAYNNKFELSHQQKKLHFRATFKEIEN